MTTANLPTGDIFFWGLVLIGGIGVLGGVVWLVRRWALSVPESDAVESWSLQHLREMRARGQLTDDEFESLKSRVIAECQREAKRKDGASANAAPDG